MGPKHRITFELDVLFSNNFSVRQIKLTVVLVQNVAVRKKTARINSIALFFSSALSRLDALWQHSYELRSCRRIAYMK